MEKLDEIVNKFSTHLTFDNFRRLFYIVTPEETTFDKIENIPDYLNLAQYWFITLILLDIIISLTTNKSKYALNDTITSMNAGIMSQLPRLFGKVLSLPLYVYLWNNYRLIDIDIHSIYWWFMAFLAQDLAYYLAHRCVHEAGVFWSFHQMHHSSEYYNFSTALRQGFIQEIGTITVEGFQSLIFPPPLFLTHKKLNTLYQFWIHNEFIPKLGPLEWVLNTPSHHRVHHGRNPYCIDKNYAGVLIIWDKIFGTFETERDDEKPIYGLVDNVKSFNQFWLQLFEFKALGYDKGQMKDDKGNELFPGWLGKFKACFGPPGLFPGVKTKQCFWWRCLIDSTEGIPKIEENVIVYNPPLNLVESIYTTFVFITGLIAANEFFATRHLMTWPLFTACLFYVLTSIQIVGYYFDRNKNATVYDMIRLIFVCMYCIYSNNLTLCILSAYSIVYIVFFIQGPNFYKNKVKST